MDNFLNQLKNIASTYSTDNIFILGKGPSADLVRPEVYAGSLVIGVNDAERIAPADITIFHEDWVADGLQEGDYRSRLYITSMRDFSPKERSVIYAPHIPLTQESSELIMQRLMSDELYIEDLLFITALKVAKKVADIRGKPQKVYLVGFDFDPTAGYSKLIGHDYAPHREEEKSIRISLQEFYFVNALYFLRDTNISVNHVGKRSFSTLTPDELNRTIERKVQGKNNYSVSVVAELTTNHFGDRLRLERMIRASKAAGANFIKLQKRDVDSFYTKEQLASPYISPFGKTFSDYRHQLELTKDDFEFVDKLCKDLEIGWFASVLDETSFHFMMDVGLSMVKLPSTISEHTDYLTYVAKNFKGSIVLSTGMTDRNYEKFVTETFVNCEKLYLLQCNSAYPTPLEDCNISVVRHYHELSKENPRIIPGYSSHDFGWKASALAVAAGARMVEKHVKLGNTEWAHFDAVAIDLTTSAFKEFVDQIRETEVILGSDNKKVNKSEHHKYRK
ncbi:N-acetylneuraminate synthase family protein [Pectobacterium brasiliense]|uniref:N-acetylneuraminate synthase family protein n=1 Tax=Pectobacterium brasiliense TaxID=180957 RepID=A0AAE2WCF7_9GAMM|nr:N-acetylneuraminate synthase family protein [Pectobacterium quasiaquaticum]MBE5215354.1 N-acetylneuraminate synthase family protein [Pectobacterium quasiaquaticum]MBN3050476.1 N-acetylneuraminate synthase family protein [Pectobacterium brasiliense]